MKRSVLTDGRGVPLGVAIAGANAHDQKLFHATLDSIPVRRPRPTSRRPQHLCCDKGFDADTIRREARRRRYRPHIKSRGEEQIAKRTHGRRARRWVVERLNSWMNRFRRILVRWEKKAVNYQAMHHRIEFSLSRPLDKIDAVTLQGLEFVFRRLVGHPGLPRTSRSTLQHFLVGNGVEFQDVFGLGIDFRQSQKQMLGRDELVFHRLGFALGGFQNFVQFRTQLRRRSAGDFGKMAQFGLDDLIELRRD